MNKQYTKTLVGNEAREALKRGIDQVYIPVSATIGAKGRNAVLDDWQVVVTNDGVSIARKINPQDAFERLGADLIKQSAERTNEEAGDGTTTSIVVSHALVEKGFEAVSEGQDPMSIRNELEKDKVRAIAFLKEISRETTDLFNVANISVENPEIARIVSEAVTKAGKNGNVIVEESSGYDIEKDEVQGYFWGKGFLSPYMVTNPDKMEAVLNDPVVIVTDRNLNLNKELMGVLTEIHQSGKNSVLIVADKVEGELLQSLIANKMKGLMVAVVVRRPNTVEELEDIATLTNSVAVTADKGIKDIAYSHCGSAKRVIVRKNETIIVGNDVANPSLTMRISNLEKEIKENKDVEQQKSRLAKLVNGVVMLKVGAKTEAERHYLRLKVDDAVGACRAALEEGVVEGGGISLYSIALKLGGGLLAEALKSPYMKILKNAGIKPVDGELVRYNVLTGEKLDDMFVAGIVDPAKVERCVIENAVSFAGTILTIESCTVTVEEEK
jgi:chaperonin GroEL